MKKNIVLIILSISLFSCISKNDGDIVRRVEAIGTLEIIAEMDINPGNVAVSNGGRIFTSIHPMRSKQYQLVEVTGKSTYVPFPNKEIQSTLETKSIDKFDAPLGILFDNHNRLWVVDVGLTIGKTRLFAYNIETKEKLYHFVIPDSIAPKSSFVQDVAIDEKNGFAYLADFGNPGIIVIDIEANRFRKIIDIPSMQAEDIDMIMGDQVLQFMGQPARIGLNPITLSADRETLYYGAMNGTKWYQLPTKPIRMGRGGEEIVPQISVVGEKPMSDGAATDEYGNHFFTNLQNSSIDILTNDGVLSTLKKDTLLDWPDNIRIHKDWLYIAVNQLHKSPAFTGDEDESKVPFRILKLKYR